MDEPNGLNWEEAEMFLIDYEKTLNECKPNKGENEQEFN